MNATRLYVFLFVLSAIIPLHVVSGDINASNTDLPMFNVSALTPEQRNAFETFKLKKPIENMDEIIGHIHRVFPNGKIVGTSLIDYSAITQQMTSAHVIGLLGHPDKYNLVKEDHGNLAYLLAKHDSHGLSEWLNIVITNDMVVGVSYPIIQDGQGYMLPADSDDTLRKAK